MPTARAFVCATAEEAAAALDEFGAPYVVKDDGLAAGKGVVVTDDRAEALAHAGLRVRAGGDRGVPRRSRGLAVRDHRRQRRSTRCSRRRTSSGSSTATRGRTPAAWAPTRRCPGRRPDLVDEVLATVLQPTVDELARRGTPFAGLLYAGLALTSRGLRVIEFNVRFGDPETQPLLALLESPLGELLHGGGRPARWPTCRRRSSPTAPRSPWCMASRGYPESSSSGDVITGVDAAEALTGVHVSRPAPPSRDGELVTAGGRVLAVAAPAPTSPPPAPRRTPASTDLVRRRPAPYRHRGGRAVSPGTR